MKEYSLDKKISSCSIDRHSINEIEKYLIDILPKTIRGSISSKLKLKIEYEIHIKDSLGTARLSSLDEYNGSKFSNDIKEITITSSINYPLVTVRLTFSDHQSSCMYISCKGGKEIAVGVSDAISEIIDKNKNYMYIFHGEHVFFLVVGFIIMTYISADLSPRFPYVKYVFLFFGAVGVISFAINRLLPYIIFDTNSNEKRKKFLVWIPKIIIGIIVGVIVLYIGERFF